MIRGLANAYMKGWEYKIKQEEKYIECKERIIERRNEKSKPYKRDLEFVRQYEYVDNSPPEWTRKDYWIGGIGAYYYDRIADYVKERW